MKRVVFHIGSPKTGTSVIQSHLAQNRLPLRDHGVLYPLTISSDRELYRTFESHHLLVYSWAGWEPFNRFRPRPFFDYVEVVAARFRLETLLLSAENAFWLPLNIVSSPAPSEDEYWERKRAYVRAIHSDLGRYDTRVIVYLRRQDHWLESWYNQQVKNGNRLTTDMDEFAHGQRFLLDYETQLGVWAEVFGEDSVVVRPYEREQLPSGLLEDYLQTLGLGTAADYPLRRPPRHNAQLGPQALAFLNICNGLDLDAEEAYRLRIITRRVTGQFDRQAVFKSQKLLSPDQRRTLVARYERMNDRIARRFAGRGDGGLFTEPVVIGDDPGPAASRLDAATVVQLLVPLMMGLRGDGTQAWARVAQRLRRRLTARARKDCPPALYERYRRWADRRLWERRLWDEA